MPVPGNPNWKVCVPAPPIRSGAPSRVKSTESISLPADVAAALTFTTKGKFENESEPYPMI